MVAEGLGVSAVPRLCLKQMEELGARCVALHEPRIERQVGLITLAGHSLSSAAQALSDVLLQGMDWARMETECH
ncbi:LysR substrate binding domain protein [compost metagenome]